MKYNYKETILFYTIIFTLILLDSSLQQTAKTLDLNEGDLCRRGEGLDLDSVCMRPNKCKRLVKNEKNNYDDADICTYDGIEPIVCCPTTEDEIIKVPKTNFINSTADRMCLSYSKLTYGQPEEYVLEPIIDDSEKQTIHITVFSGKKVEIKEFPHMAILGYGETPEKKLWGCGGSLISNRWILTASHCGYMGHLVARWARLGFSNIAQRNGLDHRIKEHILHPDYKSPSRYNDIALFRLETVVQLSKYVKPICLNTNQLLNPKVLTAIGWGRTSGRLPSEDLLKVDLNLIPAKQCNRNYFLNDNLKQLEFGITPDSMICAASANGKKNTCQGDTGGPILVENVGNPGMYMQIGIMSFGKLCGDESAPGVYTKVSNYISWIEDIVWPRSKH